jgi:exodeoxyribonuclease V alpha subunit
MIRGIGPVYAKKMVKAFGEKVFDVIEAEPDRLREVMGIGAVRAKRITDAWAEQKIVREIMVFLHSNGVGTARAVRIFKTYGADAVQVMTENPYRLARDIRGIGFKSADAIAMRLGIEKTAMIRLRAGISYALTEAMDEGHCGLPTDQLIPLAEELLEAPKELIVTALELERSEGAVIADKVGDTACTFLAGLYRAEQVIADRLIRIVKGRLPWPSIDEDKALPWVEKRSGLQLAESQRAAIRLALTAKVLVITGGPGVGKTTIVNSILKILAAKGVRLLLCAPTGRAAKRMTEATGVEAKTIHRLLEVDPKSGGFKRNADNPLDCGLLVVDEASMVDVMLMQALVKAIPDNAALLIVGDIDQLPSVGPGQVLADIIGSGAVPVVRLTEVFRQAAASRIIINAHRINQGAMPGLSAPVGESDFYFVPAEDPETAVQRILELVKTRVPKRFGLNSIRDIQVLCPMNRGGVGARSLNIELQAALNPAGERKVERFGWTFAPGDKVMQIENDYDKEVYNGDIGHIVDVDPEAGALVASFDGRSVTYGFGELDTLPAYAATIHKSQGSEYPAVIIPVLTQHYAMLQRNLLYTGVTRGKRLVVLVGEKKAVAIAVRNVSGRRRWSARRMAARRRALPIDEFVEGRLKLGESNLPSTTGSSSSSLALRRLCLRRAGALHGPEIQVEQGVLFVAVLLVLLAQAKDFPQDLHIKALTLSFCEDFLLALIQRLDLLVNAFNALDERANAIAGDSYRVRHACSSSRGSHVCSESNRGVNPQDGAHRLRDPAEQGGLSGNYGRLQRDAAGELAPTARSLGERAFR